MNIKLLSGAVATAALILSSVTACSNSSAGGSREIADGCKPAHAFKTLKSGTLTVITFELPPYSKVEGREMVGVDGDILREIAKMECKTLTVSSAGSAAVIPTAQAGRADLAAGDWYRTAARAKIVDLTDPIYLDQMAFVSKDGVTSVPQMKKEGLTVGSADGYLWVEDLKNYLGSSMKVYPSGLNCYQDLDAGRVDVCVDAFGAGVYATKGKGLKVVVAEPFDKVAATKDAAQSAFPMPKGHKDMLTAFNEDIATLRENGKLAEILKKHGLDPSAADVGKPTLIG